MANIITRIGYCPICANLRNPRTGQQFLAYGSTHHEYHILEAQRNGCIGYVPHIYKAKVIGSNVVVEKSCAMYGCGVDRRWEKRGGYEYWFYFVKGFKKEMWTLETWNALVQLKHNIFTLQYEI